MSYIKKQLITVKCDKCGKEFQCYCGSSVLHSAFESEIIANQLAIKCGWSSFNGIHLCSNCTTFEKDDILYSYQIKG